MKMRKILSGILAVLMTVTAISFTVAAQETQESSPDELVISYTKIQKGNVDRKIKANVDATATDPEKGNVVKISPIPDTAEAGGVNIDGYGLASHKIDVSKYNYLSVDVFVSAKESVISEIKPHINFLPGSDKVFARAVSVQSNETLVPGTWMTLTFNIGGKLKPALNADKQYLSQIHFYVFGNTTPASFSAEDYMLVGNFKFSVKNPNGDVYYTATFENGDENAVGTAPEPIKRLFDEEFVLPQIPFTNGDKEPLGWLPEAGSKALQPGDTYRMPEKDTKFTVLWKDEFKVENIIELNFPAYCNGICDNKGTALLETIDYEGYSVVEVTPVTSSTNGAINLDGWSYTGANISAEAYKTILVLYKYVSDKPVTGKQNLNVMKSTTFAKATSMKSREDIIANRWAVSSYDLQAIIPNFATGVEPIIRQMHFYPLGGNKVETLDPNDRVYVAKMYVIPEASTSASLHESFMKGYEDGTFGVSGNMTRAEACTIVARLMAGGDENVPTGNTSAFADVTADQWYYKYVAFVESLGYLGSYSGNFLPNQAITRAEFVELVYNMGLLADAGKNGVFTDVPADHARANVIAAAGKAGLVNGYDNGDGTFSFKPDNTITRAEVVKVINNAYGKKPSAEGIFEKYKNIFSDVTPDHWAYADILDAATGHISYVDENGVERWLVLSGAGAVAEDFDPDFEAGTAKVAEVNALFDKRVAEIRNTPNTKFDITGTTYYVSASGSDSNDGKSPEKPFATATKATLTANAGDLVLFKRGDMWRERWQTKSGVTYSAYGEGAKPLFNGNLYGDVADESLWTLVPGTNNIWKFAKTTNDIGNIVVNGNDTIEKIVPTVKDGKLFVNSVEFDPATAFVKNKYFISAYGTINGDSPNLDSNAALYVRCDEGNPGKVYNSIELCPRGHIISVKNDVTMDNIAILYTGSHGYTMGTVKNVRFQNLEIGYIGGTAQNYKNGKMTRFGNGIEVYGGCDGFYIDNCFVYQCYDAGITNQLSSGGVNDCIEQNVYFTNNVIDRCIYNIEYFMGKGDAEHVVRLLKNVEYSGNLLTRSGWGWGMDPSRSASIKGWDHFNRSENFVIKDNIFFLDRINACDLGASLSAWLPKLENNTYVQKYGNTLSRVGAQISMNGSAAENLANKHGEKNAKLFYVSAETPID